MKQFECKCIEGQFKDPQQVYLGIGGEPVAEILCAYRPKEKVTLRHVKLEANYCPMCGCKLKNV